MHNMKAILHRKLLTAESRQKKPLLTDTVMMRYAAWTNEALDGSGNWYCIDSRSMKIGAIQYINSEKLDIFFEGRLPLSRPLLSLKKHINRNPQTLQDALRVLLNDLETLLYETAACNEELLAEKIGVFFTQYTFFKRIFSSETLHAAKNTARASKQFFLEKEILFHLKKTAKYIRQLICAS